MPDKSKTFTIHYQERTDKPTIPVSGAYGGPSPDGNLVVAHVYVEQATLPSHVTHPVKGNRVDLREGHEIRRSEATREVQATLVLSPEAAIALGEFLMRHAGSAMAVRELSRADKDKET
jgi:hypothetical protein